jgi:hypothetical protein
MTRVIGVKTYFFINTIPIISTDYYNLIHFILTKFHHIHHVIDHNKII